MTNISMFDASVPVFKQMLTALHAVIEKAQAQCSQLDLTEESLVQTQLFPNMFNFIRQVQIASDFAKGVTARLASVEAPAFEDSEHNFETLKNRIKNTLEFITSVPPVQINGSEDKEIITRPGTPKERKFKGQAYLLHYGLPQFFFHITTAYDILRSKGIEIGKQDYMGTY